MRLAARLFGGGLLWWLGTVGATTESPQPLPEPLTLETALEAASSDHPALALAQAELAQTLALRERAAAEDDLTLDLSLQARRIEPNELALDQSSDDSRAVLTLNKTLYDFGRTANATAAGDEQTAANTQRLELARQRQRREIMARFFAVLEADLEAAVANEVMAVDYVTLDKLRDEHELGKRSDLDLLTAESAYEESRMRRLRAENALRVTRARLAAALDRPEQLPRNLRTPRLTGNPNALPDYPELLKQAREGNPELLALRQTLAAGQAARQAAKAKRHPKLYLELEAAEYRRDLASRDPFVALLGLDVPLYQGGRIDAQIAATEAQIAAARATLRAEEYALQQAVLETWQSVLALRSQLTQAEVLGDYRDLYLDRSRAQYELEVKTDLGDSMVEQTRARLFAARTAFELALAREKLVELTGNSAYSALAPATTANGDPPAANREPTP
ncbi:MAG: TolC family protein [Thiotrichales bacterium]